MPRVHEVTFTVDGYPPAKSEARSMLGAGHPHLGRVLALLEAAAEVTDEVFRSDLRAPLGLEVVLHGRTVPPSDATNYLGGVGDVLEAKARRGEVGHLGALASVALFENDRQIEEVRFRREPAEGSYYTVRLWTLRDLGK
jgi:hypothetical protein